MANNYLLFSESTPQLKPQELAWFRSQFEMVYVVGGKEYTDQDDFHEDQIEWSGLRAYRDMRDYDADIDEGADFQYEVFDTPEDRSVWFYAEEYGSVERVTQHADSLAVVSLRIAAIFRGLLASRHTHSSND